MKNAILFAHGDLPGNELQKLSGRQFDVVIAADGGAENALRSGFSPDYVIGDLDSVSPKLEARLTRAQFISRPSQEYNDLEKALRLCRELEVTDIVLLGACGRRLDHTLNNFSVVARYHREFNFTIYDAYSQIFLVRGAWEYRGPLQQLISLIPIGRAEGVTTSGLAFPLNDEPLGFGEREGLSNYIVSNPVRVTVRKGLLLVFVMDS